VNYQLFPSDRRRRLDLNRTELSPGSNPQRGFRIFALQLSCLIYFSHAQKTLSKKKKMNPSLLQTVTDRFRTLSGKAADTKAKPAPTPQSSQSNDENVEKDEKND
jgi:hypothetical protein